MFLKKNIILLFSTFFYIGYLPFIPGTFGSLAGLILFYLSRNSLAAYISITFILLILGFLSAGNAERILNKKDCRYIVIDEVSGMLLAFMFIPFDIKLLTLGFFLFRIFDTLKPYPAGSLQNLKGSLGIMADDLIAAAYTNIVLQLVLKFATFKAS